MAGEGCRVLSRICCGRYTYDPDEVLGPKRFRIDGRLFQRTDVEVCLSLPIPLAGSCAPPEPWTLTDSALGDPPRW